jgi:hypothetical protein
MIQVSFGLFPMAVCQLYVFIVGAYSLPRELAVI